MKALSETLVIVITAVVILVAALVLLTIFGGGIGNVAIISSEKSQCLSQATLTCAATSSMPVGWSSVLKGGKTCETWAECKDCKCISKGGGTGQTGQTASQTGPEITAKDNPIKLD